MKRSLFITMFLLLILTPVFAALSEGFEGTTFPPTGWSVINGGDANTWISGTTAHSGSKGAKINYGSTAHNDYLITPKLAPSAENYTISFWAKNYSTSYIDLFNVVLSTTTADAASFTTTLASNVGPGTSWTQYSYNLSAYVGQNVYVALQAISTDKYYLYVDDFAGPDLFVPAEPEFSVSPASKAFGTLTSTGVSTAAQTFTVTNVGGGTLTINSTELKGSNPDQFTLTDTNTASYPVSLTAGQTMTVTVAYSPTEFADHSAILRFTDGTTTHDCALTGSCVDPTVSSFPYSFGFEDTVTGGYYSVENVNADSYTWGFTTTPRTGTYSAAIRYNSSMAMDDWLYTPPLAFQAGTTYRLTFWYEVASSTYPENLAVWLGSSNNHADMTTELWERTDITDTDWVQATATFTTDSRSPVSYIGFHGFSEADMDYLYIDDITIDEPPLNGLFSFVSPVTDFGSQRANWDANTITYTVKNAGGADLTISGAGIYGANASEFTLTDTNSYPVVLAPDATMQVQVKFAPTSEGAKTASLGFNAAGRVPAYTNSLDLTGTATAMSFVTLPIVETFDGLTAPALPADWTTEVIVATSNLPTWTTVTGALSYPVCTAHSGSNAIKFNSYNCQNGAQNRLSLPALDLTANTTAHITFWMYHDADSYTTNYDAVVLQATTGAGVWTDLKTVIRPDSVNMWKKCTVDLTAYAGQKVQLALLGVSAYGNNIYVDDISVEENPVTSLKVFISEVSDNPVGKPSGTGFIELYNNADYANDLSGYQIRCGSDFLGDGTSFMPDFPEVYYTLPAGSMIGSHNTLTIGNGADEATFKAAWGITGSINYLPGDAVLNLTSGKAYDLYNPGTRAGSIDASPSVPENSAFEQLSPDSWVAATTEDSTPGELSGSQTLPVELSAFAATLTADLYVQLAWTTQSETGMVSYNIYRAMDNTFDADAVRVGHVNSNNTASSNTYQIVDQDVYPNTTYYYWIEGIEMDGSSSFAGPVSVTVTPETPAVPKFFDMNQLGRNYPNPFNPSTTIEYSLRGTEGVAVDASFVIYNARGQKVRTLFSGKAMPGDHSVTWNGTDDNGHKVASGVYFLRLNAENYTSMKKAMLLK
jgi:hypothetical protein